MSKIMESALELIGGTPLLKLNGYTKKVFRSSIKGSSNFSKESGE